MSIVIRKEIIMSYQNNVAIQFKNIPESLKFIKKYKERFEFHAKRDKEIKPFYNLFNHADKHIINEFGEVVYYWEHMSFWQEDREECILMEMIHYLEYDEVDDVSGAIFIRIGEEYGDIEYHEFGETSTFQQPIRIQKPQIITGEHFVKGSKS